MTTSPQHARILFMNMPVADIARSTAFFEKLGFSFNPAFTDESTACMLISDHAFVMLLSHEKFAQYTHLPLGDATTHALALFGFSVASRDEVDTVSAAALAEGATEADGAEDHGFMYTRSFFDLDGHGWQVMWMDPTAAQQAREDYVSSRQDAGAAN
jgi:predicted lactoylglutathione lyase